MPYLKPETVLVLQQAAAQTANQEQLGDGPERSEIVRALQPCAVCGDATCDKKIVRANGVYVHPEDVAEADTIERAEI